jgi:thymidylate kinase
VLVYITGVAGSGKSTLRAELESRGYRAADADAGFCAWFDHDDCRVPTMPLHQRTPDWYANHRWRLLTEPVSGLADQCANGVGFLLGVAANADELAPFFSARLYLTADSDVILERLRSRDADGYDTRFAAFASVEEWQAVAEQHWSAQGYARLDGSGTPTAVADALIELIPPA